MDLYVNLGMFLVLLVLCWLAYRAEIEFRELQKFIDSFAEMVSDDIETRRKGNAGQNRFRDN